MFGFFIFGTLCSYDPLWRGFFAWRQKMVSVASLPRPCLIMISRKRSRPQYKTRYVYERTRRQYKLRIRTYEMVYQVFYNRQCLVPGTWFWSWYLVLEVLTTTGMYNVSCSKEKEWLKTQGVELLYSGICQLSDQLEEWSIYRPVERQALRRVEGRALLTGVAYE